MLGTPPPRKKLDTNTGPGVRSYCARIMLLRLLAAAHLARAYNNGLGRTPPLGWSSWYCSPLGSQVTDAFVRANAEALVSSGLAAKGYVNVNVDEVRALPVA